MITEETLLAAPTAPRAEPRARPLTIGDEFERLAPGWAWDALWRWPPDTFALTSALLADSGVYRFVVCPPPGEEWPPGRNDGVGFWQDRVRHDARAWAEAAGSVGAGPPAAVEELGATLAAAQRIELTALETRPPWDLIVAILSLHALADEACEGAGLSRDTAFQRVAARRLTDSGTLARLSSDRVRVLPKLRPPESGITLRSLSHHVAIDRSEVETRWYFAPRPRESKTDTAERLSLLLVPFPSEIHASDFQPVAGPLLNMDASRYGFYSYAPQEPLDVDDLLSLVGSAKRQIGSIDALVLPEAALDDATVEPLQDRLAAAGVPYLITGARQPAGPGLPFGASYAHFGGGEWCAPRQHKHHRWLLDPSQVHQYHLGSALDPGCSWWEAISIQRRSLTFVSVSEWLTVCPLVCEDLARPDPVSDVIRAVAPTLVVGLLLDGPQLASRWPARYASVLADDPGCSVLTLTALGMTQRSQPPGFEPSRVIALWKDPRRGLQQIQLARDARAIALTAHARRTRPFSADGRRGKDVPELVLSGLEQIR